jgi:hypothetical protein
MPHEPGHEKTHGRPHELESDDPGAFIGHEPERSTETIPGGIGPEDERVSAVASQVGDDAEQTPPSGHRQGDRVSDDDVREAGQNG